MLIFGIALTILGFILMQWTASQSAKSAWQRPLAFNKPLFVAIITFMWLGLTLGGLYLMWQSSPKAALVAVGLFLFIWLVGFFLGREKTQAKKIFKLYKQLKLFRPTAPEIEILKDTAGLYYQQLRKDEYEIDSLLGILFEETDYRSSKIDDVKHLTSMLLAMEKPSGDFSDFKSISKQYDKRERAIDAAYSGAKYLISGR